MWAVKWLAGKCTCCQARWPEFVPWNLHGRRRKPTFVVCSLASTCVCCVVLCTDIERKWKEKIHFLLFSLSFMWYVCLCLLCAHVCSRVCESLRTLLRQTLSLNWWLDWLASEFWNLSPFFLSALLQTMYNTVSILTKRLYDFGWLVLFCWDRVCVVLAVLFCCCSCFWGSILLYSQG